MIWAKNGEMFDYLVCPYPEGYLNNDVAFFIDASDINGLLFIGFQNLREFELRELLAGPIEGNEGSWDWTKY